MISVSERGLTSTQWSEYSENTKRIQYSSVPTSDITAETVTVDGFVLSQKDTAGVVTSTTRPLAIQKDGTWYTYGWDLTKNICELYGQHGYIRTAYTYTPYGLVTAEGDMVQNIQWSSEFNDTELGLVYYNYRHYIPVDGRWTGRDLKPSDVHLSLYCLNIPTLLTDLLGLLPEHKRLESIQVRRKSIDYMSSIGLDNRSDPYGHWWIQFDNESYGWWPAVSVTQHDPYTPFRNRFWLYIVPLGLLGYVLTRFDGDMSANLRSLYNTLIGVPGELNEGNTNNQDSYHNSTEGKLYVPYVIIRDENNMPKQIQYGKQAGVSCKCASEDGVKDCIRAFAHQYTGSWSFPIGQNCHTFQIEMLDSCCLKVDE